MSQAENIEELREQLRQAQDALQRSERIALADRFCGGVMHEINNPLEAITNLVYLAKLEAHNPERVRRYLHQAEEQLGLVRNIARQTLSFYREPQSASDVDLIALLEAALRIHTKQMLEKRVEVDRRLPETLFVPGNSGELLEILSNLIVNSLESLSQRGKLFLRAHSTADQVHVMIADSGCGIQEDIRQKLFVPFQSTKGEGGTGLGLWLSKNLVEKHHGRIRWRTSVRPGHSGTAFRITFNTSAGNRRHASPLAAN